MEEAVFERRSMNAEPNNKARETAKYSGAMPPWCETGASSCSAEAPACAPLSIAGGVGRVSWERCMEPKTPWQRRRASAKIPATILPRNVSNVIVLISLYKPSREKPASRHASIPPSSSRTFS